MSKTIRITADLHAKVDVCVSVQDNVTAKELKDLYEYGEYTLAQLSEIIMEYRMPLDISNLEIVEDDKAESETTKQEDMYLSQAIFIDRRRQEDEEV